MTEVDEELLEDLYGWVDQIPFTRPKKDIRRDFADGVLIAELVSFYCPKIVEKHNYTAANGLDNKITNWKLLNRKVFRKLGFEVGDDVIKNISSCKPWAAEQFLMMLRRKVDRHLYEKQRSTQPEADQYNKETSPRFETSTSPGRSSKQVTYTVNQGGENSENIVKTTSQQSLQYQSPAHKAAAAPLAYGKTRDTVPKLLVEEKEQEILAKDETIQETIGKKKNTAPLTYGKTRDAVPKLLVEEKEQEILAKDETIQILQAKVRRLEHLLHLKDIRVDDLQSRLDHMEAQLRPSGVRPTGGGRR